MFVDNIIVSIQAYLGSALWGPVECFTPVHMASSTLILYAVTKGPLRDKLHALKFSLFQCSSEKAGRSLPVSLSLFVSTFSPFLSPNSFPSPNKTSHLSSVCIAYLYLPGSFVPYYSNHHKICTLTKDSKI